MVFLELQQKIVQVFCFANENCSFAVQKMRPESLHIDGVICDSELKVVTVLNKIKEESHTNI